MTLASLPEWIGQTKSELRIYRSNGLPKLKVHELRKALTWWFGG